jgi:hypothetical protein
MLRQYLWCQEQFVVTSAGIIYDTNRNVNLNHESTNSGRTGARTPSSVAQPNQTWRSPPTGTRTAYARAEDALKGSPCRIYAGRKDDNGGKRGRGTGEVAPRQVLEGRMQMHKLFVAALRVEARPSRSGKMIMIAKGNTGFELGMAQNPQRSRRLRAIHVARRTKSMTAALPPIQSISPAEECAPRRMAA